MALLAASYLEPVMSGMPVIEAEESSEYRRIHVAGVFGGAKSGGVHALVYSERTDAVNALKTPQPAPQRIVLKRTIECELLLDPLQLKSLHIWLGEKIKEYERLFGRIPSPEEVASRAKQPPKS